MLVVEYLFKMPEALFHPQHSEQLETVPFLKLVNKINIIDLSQVSQALQVIIILHLSQSDLVLKMKFLLAKFNSCFRIATMCKSLYLGAEQRDQCTGSDKKHFLFIESFQEIVSPLHCLMSLPSFNATRSHKMQTSPSSHCPTDCFCSEETYKM